MTGQTITLVTGANQGIGYEIAAGLGALGWSIGALVPGRFSSQTCTLKMYLIVNTRPGRSAP